MSEVEVVSLSSRGEGRVVDVVLRISSHISQECCVVARFVKNARNLVSNSNSRKVARTTEQTGSWRTPASTRTTRGERVRGGEYKRRD